MDSGWIKALELPAKITGGVFAASAIIYLLDRAELLRLDDVGAWVRPVLIIVSVVAGCLFLASMVANLLDALSGWRERHGKKALAEDRKQAALAHLDHLSEQETYMVAKALEEGSPSFTAWAHTSGAGQLIAKGLLYSPNGAFMTEHWPFTFHDFAWQVIENRREFFLEKEREYVAARKKKPRF